MSRDALLGWADVLDELTYYQILNVDFSAETDEIKEAFHKFAETFHPDNHASAPADEREAAHAIFKRGAEAYRVLAEPDSRSAYDDSLGEGDVRPQRMLSMSKAPPPVEARKLTDVVRAVSARPYARAAEEALEAGKIAQARLQLDLAIRYDPDNPALEAWRDRLRSMPSKAPPK